MDHALAVVVNAHDEETGAVTFRCPYGDCQAEFKAHTSGDGKARETNCPSCGEIILIPGYILRPVPKDTALAV